MKEVESGVHDIADETGQTGLWASPPVDTQAQLLLYARDLKQALHKERDKSVQLGAAILQLQTVGAELEAALNTERRMRHDLEQAHRDTIMRLMRASRFKDEETGAHIERVSRYSLALALYLGVPAGEAEILTEAAPMHDVGKIGLPDAILQKPGPLTHAERRLMEAHTTIGGELLGGSNSPLIRTACEIALTHHERWDGSGYPRGLRGEEIPLSGRIVMMADHYDALRSARCYKPAYAHDRAVHIILEGDGRTMPGHFDPALLTAFRALENQFHQIYSNCVAALNVFPGS